MRQDPLLNGHLAAETMLSAISKAYSCGRGLQKISAANAIPYVLGSCSDENRIREGVELNGATAASGDKEGRLEIAFWSASLAFGRGVPAPESGALPTHSLQGWYILHKQRAETPHKIIQYEII